MKYWVENKDGWIDIHCKRDDWDDSQIGQAYGGTLVSGKFEDFTVPSTVGTGLATAYKMAAADEMYDALEDLVALIEHPSIDHDETLPDIIAAKSALAKAKGE